MLGHVEVFRKPWDLAPCCNQTHIRIVLTDKAVVGDHVVGACCMFVSETWCFCVVCLGNRHCILSCVLCMCGSKGWVMVLSHSLASLSPYPGCLSPHLPLPAVHHPSRRFSLMCTPSPSPCMSSCFILCRNTGWRCGAYGEVHA